MARLTLGTLRVPARVLTVPRRRQGLQQGCRHLHPRDAHAQTGCVGRRCCTPRVLAASEASRNRRRESASGMRRMQSSRR